MRLISVLVFAMFALNAHAGVHTLSSALKAVQKDQADTRLLIYKTKNKTLEMANQNWQMFLSRQEFRSAPLFRELTKLSSTTEFGRYFVRQYPMAQTKAQAAEILRDMYMDSNIEFAYFEPRLADAVALDRMATKPGFIVEPAERELQNFESQQFYLNAAPEGVDARTGWAMEGGTGKGVRIIDVETGWHVDHFEFNKIFYDNGKNGITDHGTAVWGEIAARPDERGISGIAYDVDFGIAGNGFDGFENYPRTIAAVIEHAVTQLQAGDILVIEQHAPLVDDYGPIEYFEPVFKVLQLATAKGIHCVAAAGNGYSNLDDPKYQGAFDLTKRDSGCVMVGAVDSPKGSRVRQKSDFSNYGGRVDAYGYGEDVTTSGYGDLWDGQYQMKLASYTSTFSGTSSATPIVTGAVASVLGIAKARGVVITPAQMREALRQTGTPQEGDLSQRVGNLPNIPQLVEFLMK